MMKHQPKKMEPKQIDKFRQAARDLECDVSEKDFEERLREIAKSPPQPAKKDKDKAPE